MSLDNESIIDLLNDYDQSSKALKRHLYKLCWHMRGGISIDEIFQLGSEDIKIIEQLVEENIKVTNETRLPFF